MMLEGFGRAFFQEQVLNSSSRCSTMFLVNSEHGPTDHLFVARSLGSGFRASTI